MDLGCIYRSAVYAILRGHRRFNIVYGGNAAIKLYYFAETHVQLTNPPCIYLRNKSWKPECVGSFNMDWRILVFYPEPEARDTMF